jgi:single-stranded-DNA-specific exonuclease
VADTVLGVERSLTGRRWIRREADARLAAAVAQRLAAPELIGRLLAARGVLPEEAPHFLDPRLRVALPDPSLLLDMDAAADRLAQAVRRGETVAVFGDYDVDGACAGALMAEFLQGLGCEVRCYVPDRLREGYGPNAAAIRALCDGGATLILCVDCGIAAHEALAAAHGRADVVILDHHKAEGPPPPVLAAVNPNRLEDRSGLHGLCAAAVAFLAAVATVRSLRRAGWFAARAEPDLFALLDLVALATVCDVMPLTGVNRALVAQGLKVVARRARPGIAALLDLTQQKDTPTAHTLGYVLGPRINAAGRVDRADLGLRLLLERDPIEARAMAEKLDEVNRRRQQVEADVLAAAFDAAERQAADGRAVLLLCGERWHPGVVGIVAGRVKERFNRPACVAGIEDGLAKGSGRSVPGVDLGAAVIAARQAGLLKTGGGHPMAAGFSFDAALAEAVHSFLDRRLAQAAALPSAADLTVEGVLPAAGATTDFAERVAALAPFGPGNEEPVFALPRLRVVKADRVGKEGAAVRVFLEGEGGTRLKAICFRAKEGPLAQALLAPGGAMLHVAACLRAERWNDTTTAAVHLLDAAPA